MLTSDKRLFIAAAENPAALTADGRELTLEARMGNRHGLITGATGTGKTITLQNLAESFSAMGVPVLLTDIKGDLSAVSKAGAPGGSIAARIEELGLRSKGYENRGYPVCFWDVHGQQGHPLRATISDMGPMLLSRLLELNEVQSGILNIVFRVGDDNGLLLLDLKDLRAMIAYVAENRAQYSMQYGNISPASVGAIQRALLRLEDEGAEAFFGEPALNIEDLFRTDLSGRGYLNIIAADKLKGIKREKYISKVQKELFDVFEGQMRSLTVTQGALIMKLIDREVGKSSYSIIKGYKSGITAGFWQGVAKIFGSDLKKPYDPEGEDEATEELVMMWEAGDFPAFYWSIFWKDPPEMPIPEKYR